MGQGDQVCRREANEWTVSPLGSFPGITAPQQQWPVYLDPRTSGEMHVHAWDCGQTDRRHRGDATEAPTVSRGLLCRAAEEEASGPIPKFASARVTFRCELRKLRTTSNFMILVRF